MREQAVKKIGLVGAGRLGIQHASMLRYNMRGAVLSAVCSIVPQELERVRAELAIESLYQNFEEFLQEELDAVVLASPVGLHIPQMKAALESGKHVFCEKPMGVDLADCQRALELQKSYPERIIAVGFMRRFDPSYRYAKEKIESGAIGSIVMIRCYGIDAESMIGGFLPYAKKSGGIFLDLMIHDYDLVRWLSNDEIATIYAMGGVYKHQVLAKYGDADAAAAMLQFRSGAMGLFFAGRFAAHGYHIETEIIGTQGALRIGNIPAKNQVQLYLNDGVLSECVQDFQERFHSSYLEELQHFIDCLHKGSAPLVGVEDGMWATAIAAAATASFKEKRPIKLNTDGSYTAL